MNRFPNDRPDSTKIYRRILNPLRILCELMFICGVICMNIGCTSKGIYPKPEIVIETTMSMNGASLTTIVRYEHHRYLDNNYPCTKLTTLQEVQEYRQTMERAAVELAEVEKKWPIKTPENPRQTISP